VTPKSFTSSSHFIILPLRLKEIFSFLVFFFLLLSLINKLDAYGVSESALKLIKNYLSNRKQCVKIGNIMSEWEDIYKGVPQSSI
jgi:hypothetical protein